MRKEVRFAGMMNGHLAWRSTAITSSWSRVQLPCLLCRAFHGHCDFCFLRTSRYHGLLIGPSSGDDFHDASRIDSDQDRVMGKMNVSDILDTRHKVLVMDLAFARYAYPQRGSARVIVER